jgi:peroxiredoxin
VAELADALDSKSSGAHTPYRFDSDQRHMKRKVLHMFPSLRLCSLIVKKFCHCLPAAGRRIPIYRDEAISPFAFADCFVTSFLAMTGISHCDGTGRSRRESGQARWTQNPAELTCLQQAGTPYRFDSDQRHMKRKVLHMFPSLRLCSLIVKKFCHCLPAAGRRIPIYRDEAISFSC